MKAISGVIALFIATVMGESPSGPYAPSGWRPQGPAFDLPQRVNTQTSNQQDSYLPPLEPRNPQTQYGTPEDDVSVQGLPAREPVPLFMVSPISGQQYVGPNFNADIRDLDQNLRNNQIQQETFRQLALQRELNAKTNQNNNLDYNRSPNFQLPRDLVQRTTSNPRNTEYSTKSNEQPDSTATEPSTDNSNPDAQTNTSERPKNNRQNVLTVEVSKQNLQELPTEILLNSLAQLNAEPQLAYPLQQLGQIRAPIYFQPNGVPVAQLSQRQVASVGGYDALTHLAALQSILSQRQLLGTSPQSVLMNQQSRAESPINESDNLSQDKTENDNEPEQEKSNQPRLFKQQPQNQAVSGKNPLQFSQPQQQVDNNQNVQPYNQPQPKTNNMDNFDENNDQADENDVPIRPQYTTNPPKIYQSQVQYQQFPLNQQQIQYPLDQNQQQLLMNQQRYPVSQQYPINQPQIFQSQQQYPLNQQQLTSNKQIFSSNQQQPFLVPQIQNQQYLLNQAEIQYQTPQYQENQVQPQRYYQPAANQNLIQYYQNQPISVEQQQVIQQQQYQPQEYQTPSSLQSGLDVNQQGNGLQDPADKEDESEDDAEVTATAVATSFGARTSPRVFSQYGVPSARTTPSPDQQSTAETTEPSNDEGPAIAEATAIARGEQRRNAKQRNRRIRPLFTLDRTGHLVLVNGQ